MDGSKILQRISDPGFWMVAAGAVITYGSSIPAGLFREDRRKTAGLVIKGIGCILIAAGCVLLFT